MLLERLAPAFVAFVAGVADRSSATGTVEMLGVEPARQDRGVGTLSTRLATLLPIARYVAPLGPT